MQQDQPANSKNIKSIVKAVTVINMLSDAGKPLSLSAMTNAMGISKSTLHGIVSTLVNVGYVIQETETGYYRLSARLFEIGNAIANQWDERKIAYPYMQELVVQTGETVHMAVLDDDEVLYINKQESSSSIRIVTDIGHKLPAHCTGVGKALLSGLNKSELKQYVKRKGLKRYTDTTITDFSALLFEMEKIRKQGYATDEQEFIDGLRCIAVPIRNHAGEVTAALSISGPLSRMQKRQFETNKRSLLKAAGEISQKLGYEY